MIKIYLFALPVMLATSAFSADDELLKDTEISPTEKQKIIQKELPIVSIEEVINNQVHKKSYISKESLQKLFAEQLHESTKKISSATRYTTTFKMEDISRHLTYIVPSTADKMNIEEFSSFIFDPGAVDGGGRGLLIPITGINISGEKKTFRINVEKILEEQPVNQTVSPSSSQITIVSLETPQATIPSSPRRTPPSLPSVPPLKQQSEIKIELSETKSTPKSARNRGGSIPVLIKQMVSGSPKKPKDSSPVYSSTQGSESPKPVSPLSSSTSERSRSGSKVVKPSETENIGEKPVLPENFLAELKKVQGTKKPTDKQ